MKEKPTRGKIIKNKTISENQGDSQNELSECTLIIISNNNDEVRRLLFGFSNTNFPIVLVLEEPLKIETMRGNILIINSKSKNLAYKRNLGVFYAKTEWVAFLDSDEEYDDNFLKLLERGIPNAFSAYMVNTIAKFSGRYLHQWDFYNFRIFKREICRYVFSAHERVKLPRDSKIGISEARLINNSYKDWTHYWRKFKVKTSKEKKTLKVFFTRLLSPIFLYLFNGGAKDGILGAKILFASLAYPFFIIIQGKKVNPIHDFKLSITLEDLPSKVYPEEVPFIKHLFDEMENCSIKDKYEYIEQINSSI